MAITIHNKGKRSIQFGNSVNESIHAGGTAIVSEAIAKKLVRLFPKEVYDINNMRVDYDETKVTDFTEDKKESETDEGEKETTPNRGGRPKKVVE